MKRYLALFTKTLPFVLLGFLLVGVWEVWRLNLQPRFVMATLGVFVVSGLIAGSAQIFHRKKGFPLLNVTAGFLLVLPSVVVLRVVFGIAVFRFSFVVYGFAVLCALIYGVAVAIVYRQVRKESADLNQMLNSNEKNDPQ